MHGNVSHEASDLVSILLSNLNADGYELQYMDQNFNHSVRKLQGEDPSDPDFIMNLAFIFMCVVFAGLASGLTQVNS